jgi:hypothetical protein
MRVPCAFVVWVRGSLRGVGRSHCHRVEQPWSETLRDGNWPAKSVASHLADFPRNLREDQELLLAFERVRGTHLLTDASLRAMVCLRADIPPHR